MSHFMDIKQKQLSLQVETLIFSCLQTSFAIGSSGIACTTTHFDSATGFISIDVCPCGANRDLFDGRIAFAIACNQASLQKLIQLNAYLLSVLNKGYSKFAAPTALEQAS